MKIETIFFVERWKLFYKRLVEDVSIVRISPRSYYAGERMGFLTGAVLGTVFAAMACILIVCLASGCYASLKHTDVNGNVTEYVRIGNQAIGVGTATLPDGTVLNFTGQESKLPHVKIGVDTIEIGGKEVVK